MQHTLNEMEDSGHIRSRSDGREKIFIDAIQEDLMELEDTLGSSLSSTIPDSI